MKSSYIILIHKKDQLNNPLNYRPITLNSTNLELLDTIPIIKIRPI